MSKFIGIIVGIGELLLGAVLLATGVGAAFGFFIAQLGVGTLIAGAGTLLVNTIAGALGAGGSGSLSTGYATAATNPVSPWNAIYGRTSIGGTVVHDHQWGDANKYWDLVIILDCHQSQSVDSLLFDNQPIQLSTDRGTFNGIRGDSFSPVQQTVSIFHIERVDGVVSVTLHKDIPLLNAGDRILIENLTGDRTLNGTVFVQSVVHTPGSPGAVTFTYISGGSNSIVDNQGDVKTTWPDYGSNIHMEVLLGNHTATFPGMLTGTQNPDGSSDTVTYSNNPWTANHKLLGRTSVFLRLHWDDKYFSGGLPKISFLVHGKNDIYDPRTGTYGYTENWALCCADFVSNSQFGFGAAYGTEIPTADLIAAANICDEAVPLAAGGTEPRYTCNGKFDVTSTRGTILQNMLTAGGRMTLEGGQFFFHPDVWRGSTPFTAPGIEAMPAGYEWRVNNGTRELFNGVKGTYVSPANNWQASDIPPYAQDPIHGYTSDLNLIADGGERRWKDIQLPFTISPATAQRRCKTELCRLRMPGNGTFSYNLAGYQMQVLDVIAMTISYMPGWTAKLFEITSHRFTFSEQQNEGSAATILLGTEIDAQETDASIYDWDPSEELTPEGFKQPTLPNAFTPAPPTGLAVRSDSTTAIHSKGSVADAILVTWDAPLDGHVTNGGHMEIRYQLSGDGDLWTGLPSVNPSVTQVVVSGLTDGAIYLVEIRSVNAGGVPSDWVESGPVTAAGARAPLPWNPGGAIPVTSDVLTQDENFTLSLDYVADANGSYVPEISIGGYLPVNVVGTVTAPDVSAVIVTPSASGGSLSGGDKTIVLQAYGFDGKSSPQGSPITASIPAGTAGSVVLSGIVWASGSAGYRVLIGSAGIESLSVERTNRTTAPPTSITITFEPAKTLGATDPLGDHVHIQGFVVQHAGPWDAQTDGPLVGNVLHLPGATGFIVDQFQNYVIEQMALLASGQYAPIARGRISTHDAIGYFTIADTTGWSVAAGDLFICRNKWSSVTANTVTDPNIANALYPAGLGNMSNEGGANIWVFDGGTVQQIQTVKSSTSTSYTIDGVFDPPLTTSSQLLIVYPTAVYDLVGSPFVATNDIAASTIPTVATIPVQNYAGQLLVIRAFIEAANGNLSTFETPARMIYIAGKATPSTSTGTPAASPISFVSVNPSKNSSTGKIDLTAVYTPPADGTAKGVHAEMELPDFSAGDPATTVAGTRIDVGEFQVGSEDASGHVTLIIQTGVDFPASPQFGRLYLDSVNSAGAWLPLVGANRTGATPSFRFIVAAAEGSGLGQEYAPLVSGASVDPRGFPVLSILPVLGKSSSGWIEGFQVIWDDPTATQNPDDFQNFLGVVVEIVSFPTFTVDGVSDPMGFGYSQYPNVIVGSYPVNPGQEFFAVPPIPLTDNPQTFAYRVYSVGPGGRNTFQALITPQGWLYTLTIAQAVQRGGSDGTSTGQVAPLSNVTEFAVTTRYQRDIAGQFDLQALPTFTTPNDSVFGYIGLIVNAPSGSSNYSLLGYPGLGNGDPSDTALIDKASWPGPDDGGTAWDFIAVSYDVNGVPKYPDAENLAAIQAAGGFPSFTSIDGTFAPRVTVFVPYYAEPEGSGVEVAPLVDAMTAQLNFFTDVDGSETYSVTGTVTDAIAYQDARYWGYVVRAIIGGFARTIATEPAGTGAWDSGHLPMPAGSQQVEVYVVSKSANGDVNYYVPGITPGVLCAQLLQSQTAGMLDLSRSNPAKLGGGIKLDSVTRKPTIDTDGSTIALDSSGRVAIPTGGVDSPQLKDLAVAQRHLQDSIIGPLQLGPGAISDYTKFIGTLRPTEIVVSLPSLPNSSYPPGSVVILSADYKIYRNNAGTWTTAVASSDLVVDTALINRLQVVGIIANSVVSTWVYANTIQSTQLVVDTALVNRLQAVGIVANSLQLNLNGVTGYFANNTDPGGGAGVRIVDNSTSQASFLTQYGVRVYNSSNVNLLDLSTSGSNGRLYLRNSATGYTQVLDSTGLRLFGASTTSLTSSGVTVSGSTGSTGSFTYQKTSGTGTITVVGGIITSIT